MKALAILLVLAPLTAHAATFTVTSTGDAVDAHPADGVCATTQGVCTLRAAIQEANALAGPDAITLPAGTYTLRIPGADEDAGATGDLDVTDDLTISGADEVATILDADNIDRAIDVHGPAHLTLSDVTITKGEPPRARPYPDARSDGGGMLSDGTVTLSNVTFSRNAAGLGYASGGGFKNLGTATLINVTFSRNHGGDGYCLPSGDPDCDGDYAGNVGGMWNIGNATLDGVTFSDNRAGDAARAYGGDGGYAGGMWNDGTAALTHVTFARNRSGRGGFGEVGGLLNAGTATLTHVAFLHNRAADASGPNADEGFPAGDIGGMWNTGRDWADVPAVATLSDVMFVGNRAGDGGFDNFDGGWVGGLLNEGDITLTGVTFRNNRAGDARSWRGLFGELPAAGGGGGMDNEGTARLSHVVFDHNRAGNGDFGAPGGGMANCAFGYVGECGSDSLATLTDVLFVGNRAGSRTSLVPRGFDGDDGGSGGGIYNAGTLVLTNATFLRNRAGGGIRGFGGDGGGVANDGDATLTNVTMVGNAAGNGFGIQPDLDEYGQGGNGGGLSNGYGTLGTLTNVTLAYNRAGRGTHGGHPGSGNQLNASSGVSLVNTIIAGPADSCSYFEAPAISLGHNLDSGSSCGFDAPGDLSNTDPQLDPRGPAGGFPPALVLLPGSPAIDAGDNAACPATDQRGVTRPQGTACDIGAYEVQQ